ncbi:TPA: hypothetical protein DCX15_04530 [bacterium]|nr:hypothetical protein [bacterium]
MKITYLVTWGTLNGGLRVICEQTNRLIERGHEVKIFTLKETIPDWYPFKAKIITVPQFERGTLTSDITVACFAGAALAASRVPKGIPFYSIQAYEPRLYEDTEYRKVCNASYQLPLNLLCISNWLQELLRDKYLRRAYKISIGVDSKQFKPVSPLLKSPHKKILMVFSSVQIKGCLDGIMAFRLLKERFPELELVMFGNEPPPKVGFSITFFYQPSEEELAGIYSSSDIFISTSLEEGFGLPQLEAMACGVPVITTDSKGVREYAIDGKTALIVPPQDPTKLAQAIIQLLEDDSLRERIAQAGFNKAQEFGWERAVGQLEEVFNEAKDIYTQWSSRHSSPWERVLMLTPDDPWAHYALGVELKEMGEIKRAEEEFRKVIEIIPGFVFAYRELGELFSKEGNYQKAFYYLKKAKEILEEGTANKENRRKN